MANGKILWCQLRKVNGSSFAITFFYKTVTNSFSIKCSFTNTATVSTNRKNLLVIRFVFQKLHCYLYGKPLTIQWPLESKFKESLDRAPARLKGLILGDQQYAPSVVYVLAKGIPILDAWYRDIKSVPVSLEAKKSKYTWCCPCQINGQMK